MANIKCAPKRIRHISRIGTGPFSIAIIPYLTFDVPEKKWTVGHSAFGPFSIWAKFLVSRNFMALILCRRLIGAQTIHIYIYIYSFDVYTKGWIATTPLHQYYTIMHLPVTFITCLFTYVYIVHLRFLWFSHSQPYWDRKNMQTTAFAEAANWNACDCS